METNALVSSIALWALRNERSLVPSFTAESNHDGSMKRMRKTDRIAFRGTSPQFRTSTSDESLARHSLHQEDWDTREGKYNGIQPKLHNIPVLLSLPYAVHA